jgi:hypothetical protein
VGGATAGALASSLMDGLSVWLREVRRPRDRGAQPRPPLARGTSAASRVVRWHGHASLGRADGAAGRLMTGTHRALWACMGGR